MTNHTCDLGPRSGIKPHSDKNNFIITCHLALDVPEGECWIQVGDTKYEWKNGKAVIFDGFAYYNVGAAVTGSFNYQSTSGGGNCSAETSARPETYSVSVGTMPYDFTALAPLNIQFQ